MHVYLCTVEVWIPDTQSMEKVHERPPRPASSTLYKDSMQLIRLRATSCFFPSFYLTVTCIFFCYEVMNLLACWWFFITSCKSGSRSVTSAPPPCPALLSRWWITHRFKASDPLQPDYSAAVNGDTFRHPRRRHILTWAAYVFICGRSISFTRGRLVGT